MISENMFAAVGRGSILLYSRQAMSAVATAKPGPTAAQEAAIEDDSGLGALKRRRKAAKDASAAAAAAELELATASTSDAGAAGKPPSGRPQTNVRNTNEFYHSGTIPMAYNALYKSPTAIRQVGADKLLVGFDDGTVQIIICSALQESLDDPRPVAVPLQPTPLIAAKLCEFQAHAVQQNPGTPQTKQNSGRNGVLAASNCPWAVLCGGTSYMLELLTIGSDNRLAHWGVRQKDAHSSVTFVEHSYHDGEEDEGGGDPAEGEAQRFSAGAVLQLEYPMEVDLLGVSTAVCSARPRKLICPLFRST